MVITAGWQIVITGLIGLGTVGGTWYLLRANRGKIEADTAETLTRSAGQWVQQLDARIDRLETELDEVRATNRRLRDWAKILVAEVYENGGVPTPLEAVPMRREHR